MLKTPSGDDKTGGWVFLGRAEFLAREMCRGTNDRHCTCMESGIPDIGISCVVFSGRSLEARIINGAVLSLG
jgi:hypothetical protein